MEDRKKLTTMLKDFQAEQKELLAQAEQRYKVCFKYNKYKQQKSCFHYAWSYNWVLTRLVEYLCSNYILQEYSARLTKVRDVQKEISSHLHNLPDLTQLPDVTGGLAPLPSAGDLFNLH